MDHVKSGLADGPETSRKFIEQIILPTIARVEQLVAAKKILAGGPVAGRIAVRFVLEVDSSQEVDRLLTSLPLWPVAETRVTPLIAFGDRRKHVQTLLERLKSSEP